MEVENQNFVKICDDPKFLSKIQNIFIFKNVTDSVNFFHYYYFL